MKVLSADLAANRGDVATPTPSPPIHNPWGYVCVCVGVVGVAGHNLPPQLIVRDKFRVSSLAF